MLPFLKLRNLLFAFTLLLTLTNCKKDDAAPAPTVSENLTTSWRLSKYLRNGVDETSQLTIKNYEETYSANEDYSRSYLDENNQNKSETGKWKLKEDKIRIEVSGVSSIKVTKAAGSVSSSYHDIVKLDGKELWYSYTNGSDRHEFRFLKK